MYYLVCYHVLCATAGCENKSNTSKKLNIILHCLPQEKVFRINQKKTFSKNLLCFKKPAYALYTWTWVFSQWFIFFIANLVSKDLLKNFAKFTGKYLWLNPFLEKFQAGLVLPKLFKTCILQNVCKKLLLSWESLTCKCL